MKTTSLLLLAACQLFAALVVSDEPPPESAGLAIGQRAPAFTLQDQNGNEITLESLLKKGPVAIVFHRSADWCLYCKLQMVQLQQHLKEYESTGSQIVGISYDSVGVLKRFSQRSKVTFPLLSDVGSKTIDAYGVRNKNVPSNFDGVAYHATFVIDREGVIRSKLYRLSYQDRSAVDALIDALREARKTTGETKS